MEDWKDFPVSAGLPMSHVVRTGEPLFITTIAERNELFPELAEQGQDNTSLVVLPLAVEGRVFGAMALSFGAEVEFGLERREMKVALARQASQALARSRLYCPRAGAAPADDVPRRGERAAFLLARLQRDAQEADATRRARARRLVRDRHGRRGWRDRASRGCTPGPGEGALGVRAPGALPTGPEPAARRAAGASLGRAGVLPRASGRAPRAGDRRRRGAEGDRRPARAALDDLRPADRTRAHARRAHADRRRDAPALHGGGFRTCHGACAPSGGRGGQRPPLRRGRKGRQRRPGARLRRRRRRPARQRPRRAALEPGGRGDYRRGRGTRPRPAGRRRSSSLGVAHLARHARRAGRLRRPACDSAARARRARALGGRLRRGLRRGNGVRASGRDRRAARSRRPAATSSRRRPTSCARRWPPSTGPCARCAARTSSSPRTTERPSWR